MNFAFPVRPLCISGPISLVLIVVLFLRTDLYVSIPSRSNKIWNSKRTVCPIWLRIPRVDLGKVGTRPILPVRSCVRSTYVYHQAWGDGGQGYQKKLRCPDKYPVPQQEILVCPYFGAPWQFWALSTVTFCLSSSTVLNPYFRPSDWLQPPVYPLIFLWCPVRTLLYLMFLFRPSTVRTSFGAFCVVLFLGVRLIIPDGGGWQCQRRRKSSKAI